ncbi:hypothetical protein F5Y19DRAFT_472757 [Xylariaceae sp. FL1651]|nr:hypothetical protein F5Y19DRAFT_472757 [Xylariaceae sp. FL1651]
MKIDFVPPNTLSSDPEAREDYIRATREWLNNNGYGPIVVYAEIVNAPHTSKLDPSLHMTVDIYRLKKRSGAIQKFARVHVPVIKT